VKSALRSEPPFAQSHPRVVPGSADGDSNTTRQMQLATQDGQPQGPGLWGRPPAPGGRGLAEGPALAERPGDRIRLVCPCSSNMLALGTGLGRFTIASRQPTCTLCAARCSPLLEPLPTQREVAQCGVLRHPNRAVVQVIAFWFEYLTRQRLAHSEDVLLVPGSISYLLANSGEHRDIRQSL